MNRVIFFIGLFVASAALAIPTVTFRSESELRAALAPHQVEEVTYVQFAIDPSMPTNHVIPLRQRKIGNLVKNEVFRGETLSVYCPELPRVPHHMTIALHRDVKGIADITEEENRELFETIKKIAAIYKRVDIQGFVVAQYSQPQEGHQGRYVVEVIPHLPGFGGVKNIVDKVDSNRHLLFRSANLTPVVYEPGPSDAEFWKAAFQIGSLAAEDEPVTYPYQRHESHNKESDRLMQTILMEWLQTRGGRIDQHLDPMVMPTEMPSQITAPPPSKECFFCKPAVIGKQLVYESDSAYLFYNMRKMPKEGTSFLILPKRHVVKTCGLLPEEMDDIHLLRRALVEVLREVHPSNDTIVYIQDAPSVGQTVFHTHEQVVSYDPKTVALSWTLMSLALSNMSDEEMKRVTQEFGAKISAKMAALQALNEERLSRFQAECDSQAYL